MGVLHREAIFLVVNPFLAQIGPFVVFGDTLGQLLKFALRWSKKNFHPPEESVPRRGSRAFATH
jgi:hypothetical protein